MKAVSVTIFSVFMALSSAMAHADHNRSVTTYSNTGHVISHCKRDCFHNPRGQRHHKNHQHSRHHYHQKRGLYFHPECVRHSHSHVHSRTNFGTHSHHSGDMHHGSRHSGIVRHYHPHIHYSNRCDRRRDEPVFWFRFDLH